MPLASSGESLLTQIVMFLSMGTAVALAWSGASLYEGLLEWVERFREKRRQSALGEDHCDFRQATLLLSATDHQLRELIKRGALEALPHGAGLKFRRDEVEALARGERSAATPAPQASSGPRLEVKAANSTSEHCPFCRDSIAAREQVACTSCGARHHAACWEEHGKCSTCATTQRARGRA